MVETAHDQLLLAIFSTASHIYYLKKEKDKVLVFESTTGTKFGKSDKQFEITNLSEKSESLSNLSYMSISSGEDGYEGIFGFGKKYYDGVSEDGFSWKLSGELHEKLNTAFIVPDYLYQN